MNIRHPNADAPGPNIGPRRTKDPLVILSRLAKTHRKQRPCTSSQFLLCILRPLAATAFTKDPEPPPPPQKAEKPPSIPRGKINSPLSPPSYFQNIFQRAARQGGGWRAGKHYFLFQFLLRASSSSFRHASSLVGLCGGNLCFYILMNARGAAALWLFDVSSSSERRRFLYCRFICPEKLPLSRALSIGLFALGVAR